MIDQLRHVGWGLAFPLVDPASRTFAPWLALSALIAVIFVARARPGLPLRVLLREAIAPGLWVHRSAILDVQLLLARRLVRLLAAAPGLGGAWWLATSLVRWLDGAVGVPVVPQVHPVALSAAYTVALFVAWDASRYVLHRLMHEVPALWQLHQVHHSAEVLTPLTFHRLHPIEAMLYDLRGALVSGALAGLAFWLFRGQAVEWTVLGVHGLGLVFNAATGNLRHSHVWMRFGDRVERWLLSPAQHQLHHSADPADHGCNYGVWLALWDRLGGSLRLAGERPPAVLGIPEGERNHAPDDLIGALLGPLRGAVSTLRPRAATALALLGASRVARGEDEAEAPPPPAEPTYEVIVVRDEGVPRVAGSAHVIDEEELERFEYDDVHKVLGKVPGVYVRGEDGYGLRPNIGIRGANSDRSAKVTLMEDGVLLAPAPYAAPAAYYFPMTNRVAGVEVFKGPAATRHGPQTVGGAINLLTRPVPEEPAAYADVGLGLFRTIRGHGYAGFGGPKAGALVELTHLSTGGFKELDTGGPTGFERQDVMFKGRVGDAPGGDRRHVVELKLGYGRERSDETYLGLTGDDFEATPYRRYAASALDLMTWGRTQAELSWTARLGEAFDVRTVAYHHYLARTWTKLNRFAGGPDLHSLLQSPDGGQAEVYVGILKGEEDSASGDQVLQIGTNDRTFHAFGVQSVAHLRSGSGQVTNELEVGLRLHGDRVVRYQTEDPFDMRSGGLVATGGDTLVLLDSYTTADALAAHVHDELRVGMLHVLPGVRLEVIRTAAGTPADGAVDPQVDVVPLPGLGAMVQPTSWFQVFGGVHRGFSPVAPGMPEETLPETSWAWELGTRAGVERTHAELVGFFSDYQNVTGACTLSGGCTPDQIDTQFNGGAAWVYGLESVVDHTLRLSAGLDLKAEGSYTWTQTRFRTGFLSEFPQFGSVEVGDELPYVPAHQGSARASLLHERGSLSLAATGRSGMRDAAGQGPLTDLDVPGALLLDAAGEVRFTDQLSVYATGSNLADAVVLESWRPFGARPGAPRQVIVGIKGHL